ncbi:eIF-2-alpha kinase activator Gcn1p [[Candida] railenensis]|uniref:eIF-2-alpha kinase activator GCN1 n=1 Tax=[Candida] railenensis TaxID=45579 RepID=A0A9P0QTS0_9ASCO|nr:eIF-2-alpha kinase activator Gcn1p [[Candida] railenensis]
MTDFSSLSWEQLDPLFEKSITTSATNSRIPALQRVCQLLAANEIPPEAFAKLSALVLQTYNFYSDDESRKEVVTTIQALLHSKPELLNKYVKFIKDIAVPPKSIATTDLITLLTWINKISVLAPQLTADIAITQATLVESVVSAVSSAAASAKSNAKHNRRVHDSVLTATKSSIYKTINGAKSIESTIDTYVKTLTSSQSTSSSILFFGLLTKTVHELAPVQPTAAQIFGEKQKTVILQYFNKEVLLGKVAPTQESLNVFGYFINEYITTKSDFTDVILPNLEKANLRSPEVTFGSILVSFFSNLPSSVSLGDILIESKLLSQFISNLKSTKEETREGALTALKVVLNQHSFTEECTKTLISEIFKALKSISNVEQKVIFGGAISSIDPLTVDNSESILTQLLTFVIKDQNEISLTGYVRAFLSHFIKALSFDSGLKDYQKFVTQLNTGLKDKKLNLRKVWATELGSSLYQIKDKSSKVTDLISQVSASLTASIDEAQQAPLPTVSNKGIAVSYVALSLISEPKIFEPLIMIEGEKPSILSNHRVYTKLSGFECLWYLRALRNVPTALLNVEVAQAWIYFAISKNVEVEYRRLALTFIKELMQSESKNTFADHIVDGLLSTLTDKDNSQFNLGFEYISSILNEIATPENVENILIIANYPGINLKNGWTGLCQHLEVDAGIIILQNHDSIIDRCLEVAQSSQLYLASIKTLALCAFIQPDLVSPKLTKRAIKLDLTKLTTVDHSHIAIWQGQEGELVNDPLVKKDKQIDRNTKDYETKKWEQDMRKELELKGKVAPKKKYTREEQQLVNDQLSKESKIRSQIQANVDDFLRSIDLVNELVNNATQNIDNGAKHWYPYAIDHILETSIYVDSAFLGNKPSQSLLALSDILTPRLGSIRKLIGAAILRVYNISTIPENYLQEPLIKLLSRILYFVKILSDKSPLDSLSLSYVLPLLKKVMENGKKVAIKNASKQAVTSEYADEDPEEEQLLLAMEIIGCHAEAFEDEFIPRTYILQELISLMKLASRAKLAKECFTSICQHISVNIEESDLQLLLTNTVISEVFVRTAVLEVLDSEFDLSERKVFTPELWIAVHDNDEQCKELATTIWTENEFEIPETGFLEVMLKFFDNSNPGLRYSIAKATVEGISSVPDAVTSLINHFWLKEKPPAPIYDQFGLIVKSSQEQKDLWEDRSTVALVIKELTPHLSESSVIVQIFTFLVKDKALGDKEDVVCQELQEAGIEIIEHHGANTISELIPIFEDSLASKDSKSITESVVILYGALARHLNKTDERLEIIVERLLKTLDTSSEIVQYSVSECIAPLVPKFEKPKLTKYFDKLLTKLFEGPKLGVRRGAAYGISGLVKGSGIQALSTFDILRELTDAADDKKNPQRREGVSLAFYCLSRSLGKYFEPYVIEVLPIILKSLGDQVPEVRDATDLAARQIMKTTTSYGVKQLIPLAIANLDEIQWRSKKGSVELLGSMAYLDPTQLSASLSTIVPEIVGVLNDSHKEVRKAADQSLKRFGEVIRNPEIQVVVPNLLNAIGDPTKYTDDALDRLIKTQFVHYIDGPSLALIIHVIHRGMRDRSAATKRKACQIVGNMAILVDSGDLKPYLSQLVGELEVAMVDPVPGTRSTAARALGSLVEKLGEEQFPDLIPRLLDALQDESRAGDRLGSGQALAEVICGLGINKLEELLPQILANATSPRNHIRAGYMPLLLFLPVCFGSQFAPYLSKIIPPILNGLADIDEEIRDTALRAGRLIVKNYAKKAVDLLLPELEIGLSDESYRIRLSSVELTGDLLFQVTGISGKNELSEGKEAGEDSDDEEENATIQSSEINKALTEALGQDRRDRILALLFICRSDVAGIVRSAAVDIWKALVANTPRTVKEILPTLTHFIVLRLASPDITQRTIAAQTLGDMVRRVGANALAQLLPTLEESLNNSSDNDAKQGICIALTELIRSSQHDALVEYQEVFIRTIRDALCDPAPGVRESAAQAFEALQEELGKVVIDEILPHLLNLLQKGDNGSVVESENALLALKDIMSTKSDIIFPILLPSLLSPPIDSFKATALASLASVAGPALYKRLSHVINTLVQAVIDSETKGESEEQQQEIKDAFDSVLLAIDSEEGLHPLMQQLLSLVKHEDAARRAVVYERLGNFFANTTLDYSVYTQDMIGQFILSLGDKASPKVVLGTFNALNALVKKQSKESLEKLVRPTRQALSLTGVKGEDLAGFALPRGPSCILPIFLHGLMYGNSEQKELSASGIAEVIEKTPAVNLKPFATTITGPLIRVIGEKVNSDIKAAILQALTVLLSKIPQFLRPFIPQLQRTFVRSLADPTNDKLRSKAVLALGTLIEFQPRVDSLVTELVSGAKQADQAVKTSILKGILEVVSKAGKNMSESSKTSIMTLVEEEITKVSEKSAVAYARLVGSLSKVLSSEEATNILKTKILNTSVQGDFKFSILSINSFLKDAPNHIFQTGLLDEIVDFIIEASQSSQSYISDNATVAIGKILLLNHENKSPKTINPVVSDTLFEIPQPTVEKLIDQLCQNMLQPSSNSPDSRRLSLVVIRTVARFKYDLEIHEYLDKLAPSIFTCIRDPIIPIRLAAEKSWLAIFQLVEDEKAQIFDEWFSGKETMTNALGAAIQARSIGDYTKRVATRLATVERERIEQGGDAETMFSDRFEDENEVWAVGGVDLKK